MGFASHWIVWKERHRRQWSIRTWLMLLACCSVAPYAVIGIWRLNENQIELRDASYKNIELVVTGIESNIDTELRDLRELIRATADQAIVLNNREKTQSDLRRSVRLHPSIANAFLFDTKGKMLSAYSPVELSEKDAVMWMNLLKIERIGKSGFVTWPENGNVPQLVFAEPIFHQKIKSGSFGYAIDLQRLNSKIMRGVPKDFEAMVLDAEGRILFHAQQSESWLGKSSTSFFTNLDLHDTPSFFKQQLRSGEDYIFAQHVYPEKNWRIIAGVPAIKISSLIRNNLLWGLTSFFSSALIALYLAWRFSEIIAKPIRRLANSAKRIASGESEKWGAAGSIEVLEVTQQLNQLLLELEKKREQHNALTWHYAFLLQSARDMLVLIDHDGYIIETNQATKTVYGYNHRLLMHMNIMSLFAPQARHQCTKTWITSDSDADALIETMHMTSSGVCFPVEISSNRLDIEGTYYRQCFIRDISVRKNLEFTVARRNRALRALSEANHILAQANVLDDLFERICNVLIDQTGYRMAWVGRAFSDEAKTVQAIFVAGDNNHYVNSLRITWADDELGRGPTGTSIRTKKTVIARNIPNNPNFDRWRAAAIENGFTSSIALPIVINQETFGALSIYAAEADSFDDDEVALLEELVSNVANGIDLIQTRERGRKLVEEVSNSERRFRRLIEMSPIGIYSSTEGKIVYANPRFEEILGYEKDELNGVFLNSLILSDDLERETDAERVLHEQGHTGNYILRCRRKDGSEIELGLQQVEAEFDGVSASIGMAQDIGERVRANAQIQRYINMLEHSTEATLEAVAMMVEQRDPYTAGHEKRVGMFAADIGTAMGLSAHTVKGLLLTGIVHDVGKISIPAEILSKPSRLTPIEMALIREHVQSGYNILKKIDFPWPVAEVVYQHHERIDGSGYPRGLKGDQILLEAKIMAVADVVESMTSHRPYRAGLGLEAALNEIREHREVSYDPAVVDTVLKMFAEDGYQLPH